MLFVIDGETVWYERTYVGLYVHSVSRNEHVGARFRNERPTCFKTGGFMLLVDVSYLVDPASSHMLVSKIKPCMSKYKHLYCETANGSLNQLSFI